MAETATPRGATDHMLAAFGALVTLESAGADGTVTQQAVAVQSLLSTEGVRFTPPSLITVVIVLLGGLSSVAADAGYVVLVLLGAMAFISPARSGNGPSSPRSSFAC